MAFDAGTTSNRCILFNEKGEMCAVAQKEFTQYFPKPGWVEHDASEIWQTQLSVAREAMRIAGASYEDVAAIGITNQRETTIVWDRMTGQPVYHAIVWQCRRTADMKEELIEKYPDIADSAYYKTGLVFDPYFSGTKLRWIIALGAVHLGLHCLHGHDGAFAALQDLQPAQPWHPFRHAARL